MNTFIFVLLLHLIGGVVYYIFAYKKAEEFIDRAEVRWPDLAKTLFLPYCLLFWEILLLKKGLHWITVKLLWWKVKRMLKKRGLWNKVKEELENGKEI